MQTICFTISYSFKGVAGRKNLFIDAAKMKYEKDT